MKQQQKQIQMMIHKKHKFSTEFFDSLFLSSSDFDLGIVCDFFLDPFESKRENFVSEYLKAMKYWKQTNKNLPLEIISLLFILSFDLRTESMLSISSENKDK